MSSTQHSVAHRLDVVPAPARWFSSLKSRAFIELAVAYGLILLAEWTVNPVQQLLFWVTLAWVAVTTLLARQSLRSLGLLPNLGRSIWIPAAALALAAAAVGIAEKLHTLHEFRLVMLGGRPFWGYVLWTFVQQFLLQNYFLFRLLRLLPRRRAAVIAAAVLFAAAHIPNPLLIAATLVWGVVSCVLFLRYRDLYSLGLAQGILDICIAVTVPGALHHEMHVGRGYYDYRRHERPAAAAPAADIRASSVRIGGPWPSGARAPKSCPQTHA